MKLNTLTILAFVLGAHGAAAVCCASLPGGTVDSCHKRSFINPGLLRKAPEPVPVDELDKRICCCFAGSAALCAKECF